LDDGLPDTTGTDHHNGFTRLDASPIQNGANPGQDRAANEASRLERDVRIDYDALGLPDECALGEGADIGELKDRLSSRGKPSRSCAATDRPATTRGKPSIAGFALTTVAQCRQNDVISHSHGGDG
jgi:hypothetical protein